MLLSRLDIRKLNYNFVTCWTAGTEWGPRSSLHVCFCFKRQLLSQALPQMIEMQSYIFILSDSNSSTSLGYTCLNRMSALELHPVQNSSNHENYFHLNKETTFQTASCVCSKTNKQKKTYKFLIKVKKNTFIVHIPKQKLIPGLHE